MHVDEHVEILMHRAIISRELELECDCVYCLVKRNDCMIPHRLIECKRHLTE